MNQPALTRLTAFSVALTVCAFAQPCTIFLVSRNGQVLMGANEDYANKEPYDKHWVQFHTAKDGKLGYVTFGYAAFPGLAQAGMNEAGLFFDYNALPDKATGSVDKPKFSGDLGKRILAECKTVEDVVSRIKQVDWTVLSAAQMVVGDATGASAIIEVGAVTYRGTADYQIGTNFRTSLTPDDKITCWRYKSCDTALSKKEPATVESVRKMLEATMPKGGASISWYSKVCDLKAARVVLFRKGDFDKAVTIDVKAELRKGDRRVDMDELMEKEGKQYQKDER